MDLSQELLLDAFKTFKERPSITRDNYWVEVGLLINRWPIFLNYSKVEMEKLKYRYLLD